MFDRVAHFERAFLRRARGQAELDRDPSLVLVGQKAARQAIEEQYQQRDGERVDRQEQPFAIDDLGDAAGIVGARAVEARVESLFGALERVAQAREAMRWIACGSVYSGPAPRCGQRRADDSRAGAGSRTCPEAGGREW